MLELGFDTVTPYSRQTIGSWALRFAMDRDMSVVDNRAVDVACLLEHDMVKSFIGSDDYHAHKVTRFPQEDLRMSLDKNEAFLLSDPNIRALYQENYEATSGLYYKSQPSFQSLLDTIQNVLQKL